MWVVSVGKRLKVSRFCAVMFEDVILKSVFYFFLEELRDHFGKFGEIESINVKTDPQTGRSRGFAFIVFTNTEAIDQVSAAEEHIINSKKVDPKKAKARHGKIFVGGLTTEISDEEIKTYFSQFGNVSEYTKNIQRDPFVNWFLFVSHFCRLLRWRCLSTNKSHTARDSVSLPSIRSRW